jgi:hypothetical protein
MPFDEKYYSEKKQKLIQKAQIIQQEYLQGAFKFTNELTEISTELQKIEEWEKENIKQEEPPKAEKL